MTTYSTRPQLPVVPGDLHDFRLEDVYVISQELPPPSMLPVGEITHEDGTRTLVPQPVRWKSERVGDLTVVSSDGLSFTGVMEVLENQPQSHAKGRTGEPWAPVWAIAMIFAGLVLMAFGWMLNEPVAQLIYGSIHAQP